MHQSVLRGVGQPRALFWLCEHRGRCKEHRQTPARFAWLPALAKQRRPARVRAAAANRIARPGFFARPSGPADAAANKDVAMATKGALLHG
jgi:hypothetical protein